MRRGGDASGETGMAEMSEKLREMGSEIYVEEE
jgi:hypothetical protein